MGKYHALEYVLAQSFQQFYHKLAFVCAAALLEFYILPLFEISKVHKQECKNNQANVCETTQMHA